LPRDLELGKARAAGAEAAHSGSGGAQREQRRHGVERRALLTPFLPPAGRAGEGEAGREKVRRAGEESEAWRGRERGRPGKGSDAGRGPGGGRGGGGWGVGGAHLDFLLGRRVPSSSSSTSPGRLTRAGPSSAATADARAARSTTTPRLRAAGA
jgi:hypothetical protein